MLPSTYTRPSATLDRISPRRSAPSRSSASRISGSTAQVSPRCPHLVNVTAWIHSRISAAAHEPRAIGPWAGPAATQLKDAGSRSDAGLAVPCALGEEHGIEALLRRHEHRGLERPHGATRGDGHRHRRSLDVVRHLEQDHHVVVAEGVVPGDDPASELVHDRLERLHPVLGPLDELAPRRVRVGRLHHECGHRCSSLWSLTTPSARPGPRCREDMLPDRHLAIRCNGYTIKKSPHANSIKSAPAVSNTSSALPRPD